MSGVTPHENQAEWDATRMRHERQVLQGHVPILRYFDSSHLPEHLQEVVKPFAELAYSMTDGFPDLPSHAKAETVAGIRKLLEAKDCAVRARLEREK